MGLPVAGNSVIFGIGSTLTTQPTGSENENLDDFARRNDVLVGTYVWLDTHNLYFQPLGTAGSAMADPTPGS